MAVVNGPCNSVADPTTATLRSQTRRRGNPTKANLQENQTFPLSEPRQTLRPLSLEFPSLANVQQPPAPAHATNRPCAQFSQTTPPEPIAKQSGPMKLVGWPANVTRSNRSSAEWSTSRKSMTVNVKETVRRPHLQKILRALRYRLDGKTGKARLDSRNSKVWRCLKQMPAKKQRQAIKLRKVLTEPSEAGPTTTPHSSKKVGAQ